MSWDYANLSHLAKEAGGPDLLLNSLESSARGQGRIEGAGIGALAAGTLLVATALIYKQYLKKKTLANEAKEGLVSEIEVYETLADKDNAEESVAYENHEPDLDTLLGGGNVGAEEGK